MTTIYDLPTRFSDEVRLADLAKAKALLRQPKTDPVEAFDLAERLKEFNEFGYARKLLARIRAAGDYTGLKVVKVGHRHSLCTYKDTDLPVADRFRRALEIL